jgi:pimeloyl-ACP methyl ester carboxylesterase
MRRRSRLALAGAAGAGTAWVLAARADRRAVLADPARTRLEKSLPGRPLDVTSRDGTRLCAREFGGADGPAVVLVHGWTCAQAFWTLQIQALAHEARVVAYDLRGHGESEVAASGDYAMEAHAADLEAVLRAARARRPVVAGHSLGAMALIAWARDHAGEVDDRLAATLLVNTGVGDLISESLVLRAPHGAARLRQALGRLLLASSAPLPRRSTPLSHRAIRHLALSPAASPAAVAFCERLVLACPTDVRAACGATLTRLDLFEAVASLTVPTVVVAGEADRLTPPAHARRLAGALPRLHGEALVPRAGHMIPVSDPDAVTEPTRRLLRAHADQPAGVAT